MLLQDMRYYFYDQQPGGQLNGLLLPLAKANNQFEDAGFAEARRLYLASLLSWELWSAQFTTGDPWLGEPARANGLRTWRSAREWRVIASYVRAHWVELPPTPRSWQYEYANWLADQHYAWRAHDAYALLVRGAKGDDATELRLRQERMAMANPQEVCYLTKRGVREPAVSGARAAGRYLRLALRTDPSRQSQTMRGRSPLRIWIISADA